MAVEPIPGDVRDFILRHIDSVAQLEALLLLRNNQSETWDVQKVAKRLYTSEHEAAEALKSLREDGILNVSGSSYRYECATSELKASVDHLAAIYARHLIQVTNLIHGKPRQVRRFADAFKLKRDS
jgi:hypothetical protein